MDKVTDSEESHSRSPRVPLALGGGSNCGLELEPFYLGAEADLPPLQLKKSQSWCKINLGAAAGDSDTTVCPCSYQHATPRETQPSEPY